jgi:dTDP-4-amino-4,6-dideoxygalactose transaminase
MNFVETRTIPLVDLKAQYRSIQIEIDRAVADVIDNAAFIGGPAVDRFESAFARYCQVSQCVGVANGTDALFIALKTLGIGAGDDVITAANSFVATAEAIRMSGANVVFADVNPRTYTIDSAQAEKKITARTKAIIPVHLYGQPADIEPIRAIAKQRGLFVVGDAAQAHGAMYRGHAIAKLADITCFSFYPGKNLGAYGDGGALVTDNASWASSARMFANHGRTAKYDHALEGVNSRLDGIQAAVLEVKLRHLENWTERRRANARRYNVALADSGAVTPEELHEVRAVYHLYVVRVPSGRRATIQEYLAANGISSGIHYPIALPYLGAFKYLAHSEADFPHSLKASGEILSLPMYAEMTDDDVDHVADTLKRALKDV